MFYVLVVGILLGICHSIKLETSTDYHKTPTPAGQTVFIVYELQLQFIHI